MLAARFARDCWGTRELVGSASRVAADSTEPRGRLLARHAVPRWMRAFPAWERCWTVELEPEAKAKKPEPLGR